MNFNSSIPNQFLAMTIPGHQSLLGKFGGRLHEWSISTFAALLG